MNAKIPALKKLWILLAGAIIATGVVLVFAWPRSDPTWEGRPLSAWIADIPIRHNAPAARLALQNSQTNFVPLLIGWLIEPPPDQPPLKTRVYEKCNQLIAWFRGRGMTNLAYIRGSYYFTADHNTLAIWGLPELNPAGKNAAVKQLIFLLGSTNEDTAGTACFMLSKLTPEAIDPLLAEIKNGTAESSVIAAEAIGMMGTDGTPAIPELKRLLSDPRLRVRMQAAKALNDVGEKGTFLPAMLQALAGNQDSETIYASINSAMELYAKKAGETRSTTPLEFKNSKDGTNSAKSVGH